MVQFIDDPKVYGKIVELDNNPGMKPYTISIKGDEERYAWETEIKLKK